MKDTNTTNGNGGTGSSNASSVADSSETTTNMLGVRWHLYAFFGILAFICVILYGVYVPWMHHISSQAINEGDLYRDHALHLRGDTTAAPPEFEDLDDKINGIYQIVAAYMEFGRSGGGSFDANDPLNRKIVQSLVRLEPDIRAVDDMVLKLGEQYKLNDTFAFVFNHLQSRAADVEDRMSRTVGKPLTAETYKQQFYDGLCYTALPDYLETIKKIRDLFLVEPCFDRAMAAYIDAIGHSRSWTEPRMRMADLYRDRGWPEFAMMEYLRVIKLDASSADGQRATQEIEKFQGKHPEADFYMGLSLLLAADQTTAERYLRHFVETQPGNVLAPKVTELLGYMEAGNQTFVKQYLRDEIWI